MIMNNKPFVLSIVAPGHITPEQLSKLCDIVANYKAWYADLYACAHITGQALLITQDILDTYSVPSALSYGRVTVCGVKRDTQILAADAVIFLSDGTLRSKRIGRYLKKITKRTNLYRTSVSGCTIIRHDGSLDLSTILKVW